MPFFDVYGDVFSPLGLTVQGFTFWVKPLGINFMRLVKVGCVKDHCCVSLYCRGMHVVISTKRLYWFVI